MIHELDKIDDWAIGADESDKLYLFVFDHMPWRDVAAHWAIMQMKLQNYVAFVLNKDYMAFLHPETDFTKFEINVYCADQPPRAIVRQVEKYDNQLKKKRYPIKLAIEYHPINE